MLLHLCRMLQNGVPASVLFVSCHAHGVVPGIINILLTSTNGLLHLLELCVCKGIIEVQGNTVRQLDLVVLFESPSRSLRTWGGRFVQWIDSLHYNVLLR